MEDTYQIVEVAVDYAFNGRFVLDFYQYLKSNKIRRVEIEQFIESSTATNLNSMILELESYLKGNDKQMCEALGYLTKPQATEIEEYLYHILEDAWRYSRERRPGRPKKKTK